MKGYYFITDAQLSRAGNLSDVKSAVAAGVEVVQYRCKDGSSAALYAEAMELRRVCRGPLFIINDRVDIALAVDADGVHLGQDDLPLRVAAGLLGPRKIIGLTVHSVAEARQAEALGANYLGISPIFATQTKPDAGPAAGLELIRQIRAAVKLPLVAIGGINWGNAAGVARAGADCVCAISAVVTREDVAGEIRKFQNLFPKPECRQHKAFV